MEDLNPYELSTTSPNHPFKINIVIPIYEEADHIYNTIMHIDTLLNQDNISHNFILIDDGSKDNTWEQLVDIASNLDNVNAIRLSRNFGKEAALCAGLDYANQDAIIVMDADLQHPPNLIKDMVRIWKDEGYDVVEGVKNTRGKEKLIYSICAKTFY